MRTRNFLLASAVAGLALLSAGAVFAWQMLHAPSGQVDYLEVAHIDYPKDAPKGIVFLFSGEDGYNGDEERIAAKVVADGAIVVGVDTPATLRKAEKAEDCAYLVGDIEEESQEVQRKLGTRVYHSPIVAGVGYGATVALALTSETPEVTIGATVVVDPGSVVPMGMELCTGAPHHETDDGWVYMLEDGPLGDPVTILETPSIPAEGKAHAAELAALKAGFTIAETSDAPEAALSGAVGDLLKKLEAEASDMLGDLPLTVLNSPPTHGTMAILLSGDGGWRDIDSQVGSELAKEGVPTIGVDSLRYFWAERQPSEVAADLTRIIKPYRAKWKVDRVALIGYSFGADVLPAAYNQLSTEEKSHVNLVSLMAFSTSAAYEIQMAGWLGWGGDPDHPTIPEAAKMPTALLQCVYGEEDEDNGCVKLPEAVQVIKTPGGHHFDGDYVALAKRIIARLDSPAQG